MGACMGARPFDPHYSHSQASSKRPPTSATSRTACSEASSGGNSPTNGINASGHQQRQQRGTARSVAAAASGRKGCRRLAEGQCMADEHDLKEQLGQGAIATVYRAVRKSDGMEVAVKVVQKAKLFPHEVDDTFREARALRLLAGHPNIIELLDFTEDGHNYYLVLQLAKGGELRDVLRRRLVLTEEQARAVAVMLLSAVAHCHRQGVVHRDLKLDNVLILEEPGSQTATVKVADLGVCQISRHARDSWTKLCGTPWYIAPEVLRGARYGFAVDMWSVGVILFTLLCGSCPFYHQDEDRLFALIMSGEFSFSPEPIWECVSDQAKELVRGLLCLDPAKRLTAQQALDHPWLQLPLNPATAPKQQQPEEQQQQEACPPSPTTGHRQQQPQEVEHQPQLQQASLQQQQQQQEEEQQQAPPQDEGCVDASPDAGLAPPAKQQQRRGWRGAARWPRHGRQRGQGAKRATTTDSSNKERARRAPSAVGCGGGSPHAKAATRTLVTTTAMVAMLVTTLVLAL